MASPRDILDVESLLQWAKLLLLAHVVVCTVTYSLAVLLGGRLKQSGQETGGERRVVLLITAHPDDECMFFSPLLLHLARDRLAHVHLVCLTNGNYYGLGKQREKELLKSCEVLGIPHQNVTVINKSELPDDPQRAWEMDILETELRTAVDTVQPQQIFTFDDYGVSSHKNHIAVSQAIREMYKGGRLKGVQKVYHLESVSLWRKYLGVLDLPFTLLFSSHVYLLAPRDILRAQRAMLAHRSQLEWFRVLYILLSRYMTTNSFTAIPHTALTVR